MEITDVELLDLRNGDNSLLDKIDRNCRKALTKKTAIRYNCEWDEAECLFEYAFVEFWEKVKKGKLTSLDHDVEAWLCRVINNQMDKYYKQEECHDHHHKIIKDDLNISVENESEIPFNSNDEGDKLNKAMAELPAKDRQVLELFFFEGLDHESIANVMELGTAEAAKKRKNRALNRLREIMERKKK
jgi:RNA polymerase sigma factor (sigma-70 family)